MFTDDQILNLLKEAGLDAKIISKGVYEVNGKYDNENRNIHSEVKNLIVSDRKGLKCKVSGQLIFNGEVYNLENASAEANILKRALKIKTSDCTYEYSLKTNKIIKK